MNAEKIIPPIETHPLEPFLPGNAVLLMLGSFPPQKKRWSMDFFYPNLQNDMWRIIGIIFFSDKDHFLHPDKYNPQIQISAESETKRSIFREKDKTKRSKKESAQHSKSRNKSFVMTSVSAL